jgi:hypothetical protein
MKRLVDFKNHYRQMKNFYLRYERLLMPATLVVGFLFDYFTFAAIDIKITFIMLLAYFILAAATIVFINFYDAGQIPLRLKYFRLFSPLLLQFLFGALLGTSLIFYWFSGALSVSWPIILIIALLMVFNEVFRNYFLNPLLQITVYFFAVFSVFSIILPFLFNSLNPWLFLAAGGLALVIVFLLIYFLSFISPQVKLQKARIFACVFVVLALMNFFYFTNVIPPLPLALREAGFYHQIKTLNGKYLMMEEPQNFWQNLLYGQTMHLASGGRVYLYTSVFAPLKLSTSIVHHWQYYDENKKEWLSSDKLAFSITGGRKEGYKGYSFKSNLQPGTWRVFVENQRGQVLSMVKLNIKKDDGPLQLKEVIR